MREGSRKEKEGGKEGGWDDGRREERMVAEREVRKDRKIGRLSLVLASTHHHCYLRC